MSSKKSKNNGGKVRRNSAIKAGGGVTGIGMMTDEQKEMLRRNKCYISRADTNKILADNDTGFSMSDNEILRYDISRLTIGEGSAITDILNYYEDYFKNQIQVFPLLLTNDDEDAESEELDLDLRMCLRLTFLKDTAKGIPTFDNAVTLDLFLHDLKQEGAFVRLLGIIYTLKSLKKSGIFGDCRTKGEIQTKLNELESEVLTGEYIEGIISYQLKHADNIIEHTSGNFLDGLSDDDRKLKHVFMSDIKDLFSEAPIVQKNMDMEYLLMPKSACYGSIFRNIIEDIEVFMDVLNIDTAEGEDIPTKITVPDLLWTGTLHNLLKIEWMLRHVEFLTKLKSLKSESENTTDWSATLFNYIYLPQFVIPSAIIENRQQSSHLNPLVVN